MISAGVKFTASPCAQVIPEIPCSRIAAAQLFQETCDSLRE
jgi:hypothetical protein